MKPKKILIVSHYYPPHTGGIEIVAWNHAKRLAALGNDVTVVTSNVSGDAVNSRKNAGVRVVRIRAWNGFEKRGIPFPVFSPRLFWVLHCEVKRADIVHIHDVTYLSSLVASVASHWRGRPLVLTQHVSLVPHPKKTVTFIQQAVYTAYGSMVFHRAALVMTVNDRVEAFVLARGVTLHRLQQLNNGVDTTLFHPASQREKRAARQQYKIPLGVKVVLFVGRYVPKKGFAKLLKTQSSKYLLVCAGGQTRQPDGPNVRFLGEVSQRELAKIYHLADVFVLPSEAEGFPLTVQEAMASGLPVIMAHETGYNRYNLDEHGVYLLDSTSPKAIKKAIRTVLANTQRRAQMATYSKMYVQRHFSWPVIITRLDKLYDEVLACPSEAS